MVCLKHWWYTPSPLLFRMDDSPVHLGIVFSDKPGFSPGELDRTEDAGKKNNDFMILYGSSVGRRVAYTQTQLGVGF